MALEGSSQLDEGARNRLAKLASGTAARWSVDLYLAGSAALTLHLGHRPVRDLDLMGVRRLASAERRDVMQDLLAIEPAVRVETARDGYLFTRWPDGAAVRFFYYPYPLIAPEEEAFGMAVASLEDLALMKLGALISRGSRRDVLDLWSISRRLPLETQLDAASDKFGHVRDFPLQALKALADLDTARAEPQPRTASVDWATAESWALSEARRLGREHVGLGPRGEAAHDPVSESSRTPGES